LGWTTAARRSGLVRRLYVQADLFPSLPLSSIELDDLADITDNNHPLAKLREEKDAEERESGQNELDRITRERAAAATESTDQ
jgi:3-methyladenine DNA glycosylase AlkC